MNSVGDLLYIMLYGGATMASLIACLYLLLRKGNAFAPDVTPPLTLRRWAAAFFAVSCLGHFWWLLLYFYTRHLNMIGVMEASVLDTRHLNMIGLMVVSVLDCVGMLTTITGTLLAMLQDRKRPLWPVVIATMPYAVLWALHLAYPDGLFLDLAIAYMVLSCVLLTVYLVFAAWRYRHWLCDNYADLEHKEIRSSYIMIFITALLLILFFGFESRYKVIGFIVQFLEIPFFGLMLWRVETLQQLDGMTGVDTEDPLPAEPEETDPLATLSGIGALLKRHCEDAQLYLKQDLSLSQLSQTIGTNHYYLSQYFTQQGLTYNAYINGLRINHFINLYHEAVATQRSFTAQQLASESGFRSYSTFSAAFKQRIGQTVTAWMRDTTGVE